MLIDLGKNVIDPDSVCNEWVSVCKSFLLLVPGVDVLGFVCVRNWGIGIMICFI